MKIMTLFIFSSLSIAAFANVQKYTLNESELVKLSKQQNPTLDLIETNFNASKYQLNKTQQNFDPTLSAGASYLNTKEKALFSFAPIFSPARTLYSKIEKNTAKGIGLGFIISNDERSTTNNSVNNANTTTLQLTVNIDLWKNFLGSITDTNLEAQKLKLEKAKLEKEIAIKGFEIGIRKLYWALIANNEAIKINSELLSAAEKQAEDARKRLANSVSDKSEVARYESQVSSRRSSLIYQQYQRENLIKQLKELLPELNIKEIEIGKYDLSRTIVDVLECTNVIGSNKDVPYQYTKLEEISNLLGQIQTKEMKIAEREDNMDINLSLGYQIRGVDSPAQGSGAGSLQGSIDDFQDNDRSGYQVGLNVSIPFGSSAKNAKDLNVLIAQKKNSAEIEKIKAQLTASHKQLSKSINLLTNVIRNQKENSKQLNIRLKDMKKKYNQARISVNDLINDQDALLNSDLSVVQTQLEVVYSIFDYLNIFTETPCAFNRI